MASVAVVLVMRGKTCTDASIALGSVAPTPLRALKAEAILRGKRVDPKLAQECGEIAAAGVSPIDDIRASAAYRRDMCEVLVKRMICQTLGLGESL